MLNMVTMTEHDVEEKTLIGPPRRGATPWGPLRGALVCREGKVVAVKDSGVQVKILARSACTQCQAKHICGSFDTQEKIIDAVPVDSTPLRVGDTVSLTMEEKLGRVALFYGYFLPFIVMVTVLFTAYALGSGEIIAGLLGIGSLVPYYLVLRISRERIEKDFIFRVVRREAVASPGEL